MTLSSVIGKSLAVATACTPGRAAALLVSMEWMRAWAWGLRRTLPCSSPGMCTSAPYRAWPVTLSTPSWRRGLVPTTVNWPGLGLFSPAALVIRFPSLDQISVVLHTHETAFVKRQYVPLHHVCQLCAVALCWAHATPDVWPQTHPCFRSACVGRCVPHHTPIGIKAPDVSLESQTSAPGTVRAPENRRFPAGSNGVQRTDHVASSWVQFPSGSRQRRHNTPQFGGQPPMRG